MRFVKNMTIGVFALALAILVILPFAATAQQDGIILYWPLDGKDVNVAKDHSGNGKDGGLFGGAERVPGKYGSGVYLDGVDDYIEIANQLTEAGTIEFWFKPDWDGGDGEDYRLFDASTGAIYFFISKGADHADIVPTNFGFYFEDVTDADWQDIIFDPAGVINAGEWYHIAATWEFGVGGLAFLYVNGEEAATSPKILGGFPPLDANMRFGLKGVVYVASKNGAEGVMDEIAVYNRALTPEEIAEDMEKLLLPVEPLDKATSTWGNIKATY
ncbi:LamG domain-containing protein [Candidatus Poribacteria bacterium]